MATLPGRAREFSVLVYNVENLFDADGVSLFEDYNTAVYTHEHLARKLEGISKVVRQFGEGIGPDVILFIELEGDQTPESSVPDLNAFIERFAGETARDYLQSSTPLPPELEGAPSYAWLEKQLVDDGVPPYRVSVATWHPDPNRIVAHVNAVFSRFPIVASETYPTDGARGILHATLDVDGDPLHVFVNHWKSGASSPGTEPVRIENAKVLKQHLDALLRDDPHADVIVAGDFNSEYNQKQRFPQMRRTAINDVLGSQGNELAIREPHGPQLYNLWFELPNERRGSDTYHGEWGTLMQMLITRGLYDFRGVQYIDGSFSVAAFSGLNEDPGTGRPIRWQFADGGYGFSDHFPIFARFRTVDDDAPAKWLRLKNPSTTRSGPADAVPVKLHPDAIATLADWPKGEEFRTAAEIGHFFKVSGIVTSVRPFKVRVDGPKTEIDIWIHDRKSRDAFMGKYRGGDRIAFTGELGQYRGQWQFVIPESLVENDGG